jgi:HlyD family secretion protein
VFFEASIYNEYVLPGLKTKLLSNKVVHAVLQHKRISLVIFVILISLLILFRPKGPVPLETTVVKEGNIAELLTATGTVEAEARVDLVFAVPGKVTYVGVAKGDTVEPGQVIATQDQRTAQKNMENALRDYAKARNTFEDTKDDHSEQTPQTAPNEAVRRVLENNQYDLEKAVSSVELQQLARQNAILTSPIHGIVVRADVTVAGMNSTAASTYTIVDPDSLLFRLEIDNADVGKIRLGQRVKITLDAFSETPLTASVADIDFVSHKTETGGNAFYVDVQLPLGTFDYRIGMGGDAEIILAEKHAVLVVPIAALEDEQFVYVTKNSGYEKRKVKVGLLSDTEAEIISGVSKGEVISSQPDEAAKQVQKK